MATDPLKPENRCHDDKTFAELYSAHWSPVFHFIRKLTLNETEAEDLTQETFLKAFRCRHQLRDRTKVASWLNVIAKNTVYEAWRARKGRHAVAFTDDYFSFLTCRPGPFRRLYWKERSRLLRQALQQLDDFKQQLIICVALGISDREIAQLLGRTRSSVKCHKTRIRRSLLSEVSGKS